MNFCKKYFTYTSTVCLLLVSFLLSGCAGMNSNFTCPMKPGQMCSSLDQVNTMVDQGKLGSNTRHANGSDLSSIGNAQAEVTPYPMSAMKIDNPLRYGESVLRIWVAPYEDKAGNYYQPSVLYTVVRPGRWIGNPVQAVTNDD